MKEGPDIARVASLIGDPARANMLTALTDGRAWTASELAGEAGVTKQTASAHLAKLVDARLLSAIQQGRCRYFRIDDSDVAAALETLAGVAARRNGGRLRAGPKEPALRKARICYDHLAGEIAVTVFDRLIAARWIRMQGEALALTATGRKGFARIGLDIEALADKRRTLCRPCLDWSMRRYHLAGAVGAALFDEIERRKWAKRVAGSRVIAFTPAGEKALLAALC